VAVVALSSLINARTLLFVALGAAGDYAYGKSLKDTAAWPPAEVVLVAAVLGLRGTFSNLLLAVPDRTGDRASGCRTFVVRHGPARSAFVLGLLALATYTCAAFVPARTAAPYSARFLGLLGAAAALAVAVLSAVRAGEPQRAVMRHLYERLVLPGALWVTTGHTAVALAYAPG
jgi:4-hydroxybenzoate polyprenyltransferase